MLAAARFVRRQKRRRAPKPCHAFPVQLLLIFLHYPALTNPGIGYVFTQISPVTLSRMPYTSYSERILYKPPD